MVAIPVFNLGNQNYVRSIIVMFLTDGQFAEARKQLSASTCLRLSKIVSVLADAIVEDRCSLIKARVSLLVGNAPTLVEFLASLKKLIRDTLECEAVAIFLADPSGQRLELNEAGTTGTVWDDSNVSVAAGERFYKPGEGLTGWVWESARPLLTPNSHEHPKYVGKSQDDVEQPQNNACLFVPMIDVFGKCRGVIRCSNRRAEPPIANHMFSDDDAVIIDALAEAALSLLLLLQRRSARAQLLEQVGRVR